MVVKTAAQEKTIQLGQRQLFSMKRSSLEKRMNDFFKISRDSKYIIECAISLLVRNSLSAADFSFVAKELIRSIFLTDDAIRSMPFSCLYFRDYFSNDEWQTVITRLFGHQQTFQQVTKDMQASLEMLRPHFISGERPTKKKTNMISYFKDEADKRHSWNLSNVNPDITKEEHFHLMSILSTLTIFHKEGVRKFATPIYADFLVYHPSYDTRNEEEASALQAKNIQLVPIQTLINTITENQVNPLSEDTPTTEAEEITHENVAAVLNKAAAENDQETLQAVKDFLMAGFDPGTLSPDELNELAKLALIHGKSMLEVYQEINSQPNEEPDIPVDKPLTNKERMQQLLQRKNQQRNRSGLLNQINRRGKKRK
ncbi:hypothetical protein [Enterococcus pallens]|uniref:Uncharacterized protein n=1 Tax=Enterococcus pallens ATCC BAA-351 TaxID=1158607 RepID=R2SFZ6_9ENTE|nr:hypothetical protein [Enterococcus pallens]EOH94270.1 hypothetical protein UAU_02005 [Enterococcus pallens ATCC BAA-351]EOU24149.1 hypothetical protein I588_00136 [Enterococcus pallens ATCC BAA-351]OJG82077.1 hypothetical protein RV10_GL001941 [Enterococcus pallens]